MLNEKKVSDHYLHGDLLNTIQESIARLGKTVDDITIEDLASVDEFHIGGRKATEHFLSQLNFSAQDHVLDVGCGLGGAARFVASNYKNQVTGIDLTQEYIDTGKALSSWVKLDKQITLQQSSALSMPFEDSSFDGAYMMHVGMNIEDKQSLFAEVSRVLRPGAVFGIYDIMRQKDGDLAYPVPWATESNTSKLATPDKYKKTLNDAGFEVSAEQDRREFALDFFKALRANAQVKDGPPPLGLHILMKDTTPLKIKNMIENVTAGYIAPFELIAHKR